MTDDTPDFDAGAGADLARAALAIILHEDHQILGVAVDR